MKKSVFALRLGLIFLILNALPACQRKPRPNVLLITIDTLRADRLGAYGFGLARTPHIDRLAREGVRCDDAVATAPITVPSHASIFTGLYPPAHGVRDNGVYALSEDAVTLAERLKDAGYATQAIVSAVVLNRRYNLNQGFDVYDDDLYAEDRPALFMIRDRPAVKTAERFVAWLEERSARGRRQPFFAWVHFFDPHQPYEPRGLDRILSPTPYDGEIAAADRGVGQVIDALRDKGALDDTVVVLTSDHGEGLGEHEERSHAVFVYDSTVRVPLIFRFPPAFPAGSVYRGPVRSVDIVPTLLATLGLPGEDETQGVNLLPALNGDVAPPELAQYSETLLSEIGFGMAPLHSIRAGGYKWIRAPKPELYDLGEDPRELNNLFAADPQRAARLDRELQGLLDASASRALSAKENPMDRETEEMLLALGYLAPQAERDAVEGMDPKDGIVYFNMLHTARAAGGRGQWEEAERVLRDLLEELPRHVTARNNLAYFLVRQGRFDEASDQLLQSLALQPKQHRAYAMLGAIALRRDDLDQAERFFDQALELTPQFVEALANRGFVESLRGREDEARAWYQRALESDPGFHGVHRRLGDLHYEKGDYAAALEHYRKATEIAGNDFAALIQAGNSARRINRPDLAAQDFERASKVRSDSWIPSYNLACLRAVGGEPEAALALLEQAVSKGLARDSLLEDDPDLTEVRGLAGFAQVVETARLNARRDAAP